MIIRKLFKVESAHRVPQCSTQRCKSSLHGHSAKIEVFFDVKSLDFGSMGIDFGLMKSTIKDVIDSMDHTFMFWNKEPEEYKSFIKKESERWIELPISCSAEGIALTLAYLINKVINNTKFANGEDSRFLKVRYHETDTGWAEADITDVSSMWIWSLDDIHFSDQVRSEWINPLMIDYLKKGIKFINDSVVKTHGLLDTDIEIWRDVEGFENNYQVSSLGRVRSIKEGKVHLLKGYIRSNGYLQYCFWLNGQDSYHFGHRIVAKTFCEKEKDGELDVNHIDGDKLNNRVENLEWVTRQENVSHAIKNGLVDNKGSNHGLSKLKESDVVDIRRLKGEGFSSKDLSEKFNVSTTTVNSIVAMKSWRHVK